MVITAEDIKQQAELDPEMNLEKNVIPSSVRTIHLIAACGTAMGALACMLRDLGHQVTGSDNAIYPPMSTFLREKGITIHNGFSGEHLEHRPDLVVVGNAVSRDNPEAVKMREMNLNFCSMPQAVNRFLAGGKNAIVVAGTHGKTTTSSIAAWVLHDSGYDPSFFVGGILQNFQSNYRLGSGGSIVIEGDEYDTAYFDKGPKFFHYDPSIAILTGVEFDHADIFNDIDQVTDAFKGFVARIASDSTLVAYDDNDIVNRLVRHAPCRVERYGLLPGSHWRLGSVNIQPPWTVFEVLKHGKPLGTFKTDLKGFHNLTNLLSVIAASCILEIPVEKIASALETFAGVKRRQEIRGIKRGITVMDDFAHHPTAVRETIRAVKPFYPLGRLIAIFEPRTNTSMRNVFQDVYPHSFDQADLICIRKPSLLSKIPEWERFSSEALVRDLQKNGKEAHYFPDTETIIDFVAHRAKENDIVLIMSNGGFDNIHKRLLEKL